MSAYAPCVEGTLALIVFQEGMASVVVMWRTNCTLAACLIYFCLIVCVHIHRDMTLTQWVGSHVN